MDVESHVDPSSEYVRSEKVDYDKLVDAERVELLFEGKAFL